MSRLARVVGILFIILALLLIGVSVKSMYSRMQTIERLKAESKKLSMELKQKRELLRELQKKVSAYKMDPRLLKDEATKRFLMIRQGETLILFKKGD